MLWVRVWEGWGLEGRASAWPSSMQTSDLVVWNRSCCSAWYLSCCKPIHQPESSSPAGDPCVAGISGTPSVPLSSPLSNPPVQPQALYLAQSPAAFGGGEGHAEGPGGTEKMVWFTSWGVKWKCMQQRVFDLQLCASSIVLYVIGIFRISCC